MSVDRDAGVIRVRQALVSVSDKDGIIEFAKGLAEFGVKLISTGGTAKLLRGANLKVVEASEATGFPEMLDGRVKTLHPVIHGAILARRSDPGHLRQLEKHQITPIDLVVVNLYPFAATIAQEGIGLADAIEQIDIGGPALIRSAAKNFEGVAILTDPRQYPAVLEEMRTLSGGLCLATRLRLAQEAFRHTARYDGVVASYLSSVSPTPSGFQAAWPQPFPPYLTLHFARLQELRYGENPHQRAALYRDVDAEGASLAHAQQLQGKELSYNNLLDLDAALHLAREFTEPAACVIKHTNPCGVATANTLVEAYRRARDTDPPSAYGGILGFNRRVDEATAREIASTFVEAIIAPGYTEVAREVFRSRKTLRAMEISAERWHLPSDPWDMRRISGGLLLQERDRADLDETAPKVVTKREPTGEEWQALAFAWKVVKHVKSNAVVFATTTATVGIGAGQMSRVDACRIAAMKAQFPLKGTVVASDAFFPFRDGIDAAAEAGATAIIQPGGSIRDAEVIQAADDHGMAMVFTGVRHFRH
jgi:phosphoribosylaminoimidazolecarboxamide formyltransferase/IMP cyclohydrolase